jgi:hypothetical protein
MADSADSSTLRLIVPDDPVRRLSPEQDFRLRIARNDLDQVRALELAGATAFEVGALRSNLLNALAIIDHLTGERA